MATVTVLYPKDTKFDMKYYESSHMPMVLKTWKSYGMKGYKVVKIDDEAPHSVLALLYFDSTDQVKAAASGPEMKNVMDDIPNFSDQQPIIMPGADVFTA